MKIPNLTKLSSKFTHLWSSKPKLIIATGASLILIIVAIIWISLTASSEQPVNTSSSAPQFNTVLPEGKTIESLGGWTRISPPNSEPVFTYKDSIANVGITVSQQVLPKSLNGEVTDIARDFNSTDAFKAGDTTVYIGTNSNGPQSVIFTKQGLLVTIKSQGQIDDTDWSSYVQSLN